MIGPILRFKAWFYGGKAIGPYSLDLARKTPIWRILGWITAKKPKPILEKTIQDKILNLAEKISFRADYADTSQASKRDAEEIIKLMSQWRPL